MGFVSNFLQSGFLRTAARFSGSQQLRNAIGSSNTAVQLFDPFGAGMENARNGAPLADITDPGGVLHNTGVADTAIRSAPSPSGIDSSSYLARDQIRRLARRAQGIDSTIRTSSTGAPYTAQPKTLLGS